MMNEDDYRRQVHQYDYDGTSTGRRVQNGNIDANGAMMQFIPEGTLYFKLLCPQSITGLIIGRGGSIINQLNANTGAKIKLSQNNEFFPGTNDRILLVSGERGGIENAVRELVTRISEAADKKPNSNMPLQIDQYGNPMPPANRGPQGTYQIKIIIPKAASASIIGKSGTVIRRMAEMSNCKFQLGEESDPFNTRERIVTINSQSVPNLVTGAHAIMYQLLEDAKHRTYPNLTTNYGPSAPGGMGNDGGGMMGGGGGGMGGGERGDRGGDRERGVGGGRGGGGERGGERMPPSADQMYKGPGGGGGGGGGSGGMQQPPPPLQMSAPPQMMPQLMNPMMGMNGPPYGIPGLPPGAQFMGYGPPGGGPMQLPPGHPMAQQNGPMYSMMPPPQQFAMGPPGGGGPQLFYSNGPPMDPAHHQMAYANLPPGMVVQGGMYGGPTTGGGGGGGQHPSMKKMN